MQAAVFVDQQRAYAEACLFIEMHPAAKCCFNAFEAPHKSPVAQPQILEIPP